MLIPLAIDQYNQFLSTYGITIVSDVLLKCNGKNTNFNVR